LAYIDDNFIDQVRFGNDIIDVISEYLQLERSGSDYKGLCPFHDENTPSFMVSPDKQLYHCFGCGAGGNIFNFIMEIENVEFIEAVEILAERIGLSLPEKDNYNDKKRSKKGEIYEIHDWAVKFFNYLLTETKQGEEAYNYLKNRGFDEEIIKKFQLGYAPDSWDALFNFLKKKGYSVKRIHQSGLIIPRKKGNGYYDRFRNRLIFTICNPRGQTIGFGGRVLDDSQPKYLNSPETIVFNKRNNLYGLHLAKKAIRRSGSAVIVEGYTDMITGYQFGIKNLVASLGTSLTKAQAQLLKRYAERVYIAYDGDTAGESATLRGLDILKEVGVEVYVVNLPQDSDPDEVIRERGKENFDSLLEEAVSLIEFKMNCLLEDKRSGKVEDKVKAVERIIPILAQIENQVEREEYIKQAANKVETNPGAIKARLKNYIYQNNKVKSRKQDRNYKDWNNKDKFEVESDDKINDIEDIYLKSAKDLLRLMLDNRQVLNLVKEELESEDFIIDKYRFIAELIYNSEADNFDWAKLIEEVEDQKIKELITELALVTDEIDNSSDYQEDIAKGYIKKIKEYQLKMKKKELEEEIQKYETNNDFSKVNDLLREYQELCKEEVLIRKEGD